MPDMKRITLIVLAILTIMGYWYGKKDITLEAIWKN